ncbi:MAG: histidine kinase [Bernardetiaceae bacterium]|nr:histidine kinase [Bernardetiaceae bacterium]
MQNLNFTFQNLFKKHKIFLLLVFLFIYARSVETRILVRQNLNIYVFTPEVLIIDFTAVCLIFLFLALLIQGYERKKIKIKLKQVLLMFFIVLFLYLIVANILSFAIAYTFDKVAINFNTKTLLTDNMSNIFNVFMYSCIFFAYFFYVQNQKDAAKIANYNQALAQSKITQLKAQLNPHFLFNNLNILDQLIEEAPTQASAFLTDFSDLYRYVLQMSEQKLVHLDTEIAFVKKYFAIMKHKYGDAYILDIVYKNKASSYIPPLTLQLLVENAIKHNFGTEQKPIFIQIEIAQKLSVTNTVYNASHKKNKFVSGRGLKNLYEQYQLLSNEPIKIVANKTDYTVELPLIFKQ